MTRLPAEMTAACIRRTGGWDEIEISRLPLPVCGRREVLVQVEALAVNHVDRFVRSGAFPTALPWPFIIGRDLAGRIVAVGEAVENLSVGDRVWCNGLGHDGRQGSFSEYALAPAERVYPLPDGVDSADAVSVVHSGAAAWLGLFREGRVHDGACIFIAG